MGVDYLQLWAEFRVGVGYCVSLSLDLAVAARARALCVCGFCYKDTWVPPSKIDGSTLLKTEST